MLQIGPGPSHKPRKSLKKFQALGKGNKHFHNIKGEWIKLSSFTVPTFWPLLPKNIDGDHSHQSFFKLNFQEIDNISKH